MLEILNAPATVLSMPALPIEKINSATFKLIKDMTKALESATDPVGVGLAAPQVGVGLRLFIAKPSEKSKVSVFINPKITSSTPRLKKLKRKGLRKLEGCLSLKDIWGEVERFPKVTLEFLDEKGVLHSKTFSGFMSTIIQHEMDHLEGVLFPKRVLEQKGILYHSTKDEKNQDIFEEIKI